MSYQVAAAAAAGPHGAQLWLGHDQGINMACILPQVAANAAVALAWRLPLLQGLMARNFTHLPGSGRSRTLLTSVFSHRGALHLTVSTACADHQLIAVTSGCLLPATGWSVSVQRGATAICYEAPAASSWHPVNGLLSCGLMQIRGEGAEVKRGHLWQLGSPAA